MNDLTSYLPQFVRDNEIYDVERAVGTVLNRCWDMWESLVAQLSPKTATWGLEEWEKRTGLSVSPGLDVDERRSKIVAKLRSRRTATKELIKSVAESYSNGEVEIFEDFDKSEIAIHFCGQYGVPKWLDAIKADIKAIIPAHLDVCYERDYLLISEVSVMTLSELNARPLSHFAGGAK